MPLFVLNVGTQRMNGVDVQVRDVQPIRNIKRRENHYMREPREREEDD